nr:unnamed protein product [Callosobruchus chinensis]
MTTESNPTGAHTSKETQSYSNTVRQQIYRYPSKEQAIVFNAINGATIQDYLLKIGPLVKPENILFCSRISNNRVCIYFSSKDVVDKFLDDYNEITLHNSTIKIRRLLTPATRLVISNVCPTIPHDIIEDNLQRLGLNLVSPISFLRIGATLAEYSHILSFRRQVYISHTDTEIPQSFEVTHENVTYRVFFSSDSQKCYKCNTAGHIAARCPNNTPRAEFQTDPQQEQINVTEQPQTAHAPPPISSNTQHVQVQHQITPTTASTSTEIDPVPHQTTPLPRQPMQLDLSTSTQLKNPTDNTGDNTTACKRSFSATVTQTSDCETTPNKADEPSFLKPKTTNVKKHKVDTPPSYIPESMLHSLREFMDRNPGSLVINCDQLKSILENAHGNQNIIETVKEHTENIKGLIETILLIYPNITDRALKNRCTRLRKKLERHIGNDGDDSCGETSSTDSICF